MHACGRCGSARRSVIFEVTVSCHARRCCSPAEVVYDALLLVERRCGWRGARRRSEAPPSSRAPLAKALPWRATAGGAGGACALHRCSLVAGWPLPWSLTWRKAGSRLGWVCLLACRARSSKAGWESAATRREGRCSFFACLHKLWPFHFTASVFVRGVLDLRPAHTRVVGVG